MTLVMIRSLHAVLSSYRKLIYLKFSVELITCLTGHNRDSCINSVHEHAEKEVGLNVSIKYVDHCLRFFTARAMLALQALY